MVQIFATKKDVNGNRVYLTINHEEKRFYTSYFEFVHPSDICATITRKKMWELCNDLKDGGYKEFLKIH